MTDPVVVTNLRLPKSELDDVRAMAGELGMSVNEYLRVVIRGMTNIQGLVEKWVKPKKGRESIWDLPELAKMKNKPMGLSKEDEEIYAV